MLTKIEKLISQLEIRLKLFWWILMGISIDLFDGTMSCNFEEITSFFIEIDGDGNRHLFISINNCKPFEIPFTAGNIDLFNGFNVYHIANELKKPKPKLV
jgi:hypothetical protein